MKMDALLSSSCSKCPNKGFTLIEVTVALAILGWVLGSALFLVSQYANERLKMRDNFLINQVAWNQLLDEYRYSQQPQSSNDLALKKNGRVIQGDQQWYWKMEIQSAVGQDLYKYQMKVAPDFGETEIKEEDYINSSSLYLVR